MTDREYGFLDHYFARFLCDRAGLFGIDKDKLQQLVRALTSSLEEGHSCLPVNDAEAVFLENLDLVSSGDQTPLVLYNNRLYLHRNFHYELRLARQISEMAKVAFVEVGTDALDRYFEKSTTDIDWQRQATKLALERALTIICGGPGTGKTTTVVKILALLFLTAGQQLRVSLAAPTGKAAMRLSESISNGFKKIQLSREIDSIFPTEAQTLHRLLGFRRHSPQFRHNRENPLDYDVVVVDEASMVDLAMMSKLVDALRPGTRLLLLGDKDQLASVESGAVLGDLIKSLPENTVELQKTYRFDDNIKRFAKAVNTGDATYGWKLLTDQSSPEVALLQTDLISYIGEMYALYMTEVVRQPEPDVRTLFTFLNRFQVLTAVHYGNQGVEGINRRVEAFLAREGFYCHPGQWYPGRPVLVTRNDYSLELFNGDIGICLRDSTDGSIKVWFLKANNGLRGYSPYRIPSCETVYAMTIHKSQGSEFDEVVVVLPEEDNRILSRELIYTAITRARKAVRLVAGEQVFSMALSRNIVRNSGLSDLLKERL